MSNISYITRTEFRNYGTNEVSYGYRIWDNYGQHYSNNFIKEDLEVSAEEFLEKIVDTFSEVADAIFDNALERGCIYVDDERIELVITDGQWEIKRGPTIEETLEIEEQVKNELGVDRATIG